MPSHPTHLCSRSVQVEPSLHFCSSLDVRISSIAMGKLHALALTVIESGAAAGDGGADREGRVEGLIEKRGAQQGGCMCRIWHLAS